MNWPLDADGDVFRRLEGSGFDFSKQHLIDFNVDFEQWPPPGEVINALKTQFLSATVYEPAGDDPGTILVQVHSHVDYAFVTRVQREITDFVAPFGGICESWGLLHD